MQSPRTSSPSSSPAPPLFISNKLSILFPFLLLLLFVHVPILITPTAEAATTPSSCDTLNTFYAHVSISHKQLHKFMRRAVKFSKLSANFPVFALAKHMRGILKQCKKHIKPSSKSFFTTRTNATRSRFNVGLTVLASLNISSSSSYDAVRMAALYHLGATSARHGGQWPTTLVDGTEIKKNRKKKKKKKGKKKRTIAQKEKALQRMCVTLQKQKAEMGIAEYVENVLYDAYLLGKPPPSSAVPSVAVTEKGPRSLEAIIDSLKSSSSSSTTSLTTLDLYDAINDLLLSVPSHAGTCAKLCPCSVINRSLQQCTRRLVRSRVDSRCVQVDDPSFIPGGRGQLKSDKSGQLKDTRCSTVAIEEAPPSSSKCPPGTLPWKTGFALFNSTNNKAACAHFTLEMYCDAGNKLGCAGGRRSERDCCRTKCARRMCGARRRLFETFGVLNLFDKQKCVLRGIAADVSFSVLNQQRHCKDVCLKSFRD